MTTELTRRGLVKTKSENTYTVQLDSGETVPLSLRPTAPTLKIGDRVSYSVAQVGDRRRVRDVKVLTEAPVAAADDVVASWDAAFDKVNAERKVEATNTHGWEAAFDAAQRHGNVRDV